MSTLKPFCDAVDSAKQQSACMPPQVIQASALLQGARRVWIEHEAERYLLQVTRNGKLILTK
ncbi:MAG TPA: hemin uptake protein HemP [Candidatus Acidoferrum sp.]|nr:hemin uptake protein HemP [Candidatus Acidoferrum sp.]